MSLGSQPLRPTFQNPVNQAEAHQARASAQCIHLCGMFSIRSHATFDRTTGVLRCFLAVACAHLIAHFNKKMDLKAEYGTARCAASLENRLPTSILIHYLSLTEVAAGTRIDWNSEKATLVIFFPQGANIICSGAAAKVPHVVAQLPLNREEGITATTNGTTVVASVGRRAAATLSTPFAAGRQAESCTLLGRHGRARSAVEGEGHRALGSGTTHGSSRASRSSRAKAAVGVAGHRHRSKLGLDGHL